jgi:hypothetical protein
MAGLFAFVLGALLLWLGWRRQQKVKASMSWPYVPGRVIAAFPAGNPVLVYYDPANPQNAVLERRAHGNNILLVVGGILVLAAISSLFRK